MRSARMLLIAILGCAAASVSATEDQLPTAVDLKAAYCLKVYRWSLDLFASALNAAGPGAPVEFKNVIQSEIDRANARMRHIGLYLVPRLLHLDMTGIIVASKSAEADTNEARTMADQCKCDLGDAACRDSCLQQHSELSGRLKSCQDLSFLPF